MKNWIGAITVMINLHAPLGQAENLALTNITILSMEQGESSRQGTLLIEKGRIQAIEDAAFKVDASRYRIIAGQGKFVIPGLVDSHIHFFQSGSLYTRPDAIDLRYKVPYRSQEFAGNFKNVDQTFRRYLASGVTSVVDMGGPMENFKVRDKARQSALAPQVYVAGPLLSTVERKEFDVDDKPIVKVASPEEANQWVNKLVAQQPDFIKIWYIIPPGGSWKDNASLVQGIIESAHKKGQKVAVHATQLETARAAVQFGADVLVHSVEDAPVDKEFVNLLQQKGVFYIPTLAVTEGYRKTWRQLVRFSPMDYRTGDPFLMGTLFDLPQLPSAVIPARIKDAMSQRKALEKPAIAMQNLKTLADAGVNIVMGTDAGNIGTFHGSAVHRELEMMVEAGIKPIDALRMSTFTAAKMLRVEKDFGSLKAGKVADMLILDRDPREDIRHVDSLHAVIKGGVSQRPAELLPKTPAEIVQSQLNAYHSMDIDSFVSHFASDAKYGAYQGKVRTGHAGLRETWGQLFERSEWIRLRIAQRVVKGPYVFDVECGFAKTKEAESEVKSVTGAALYKVEKGLIQEMLFMPAGDEVPYPKELSQAGTFNLAALCAKSWG